MTVEAAAKMIEKATSDSDFMSAMGTALEGASDVDSKCQALTSFGAENGFEFTLDEAKQMRSALRTEVAKNDPDAGIELSDEDLENVSGGFFAAIAAAVSVTAAAVSINENVRGKGTTGNDLAAVERVSPHGVITGGNPFMDWVRG